MSSLFDRGRKLHGKYAEFRYNSTGYLLVRNWSICPVESFASSYHDNESMWIHLTVYVERGHEHLSFGFLVG